MLRIILAGQPELNEKLNSPELVQLAQRVRLRRVPELEFFFDKSVAHQDRIEQVLQELKAEADTRPPAPPDDVPHDDSTSKD